VALPPPDTRDVEAVLHRALRQLRRRLADVEGLHLEEDDASLLEGSQPFLVDVPTRGTSPRARLAVAHGFSLHADTAVRANDRQGLETLCRYGVSNQRHRDDRVSQPVAASAISGGRTWQDAG
jgi:hypothetical protein